MLKNEESCQNQKDPFFRWVLNDFEAEWITCGCIYKVRKREWKAYRGFVELSTKNVFLTA